MGGGHIVVYPLPQSGHVIPALDLTRRLLTRGLTVTFLVTPNNLPLLHSILSLHASSLHTLLLPASDHSPSLSPASNMRRLRDLHYPALLSWFKSHTGSPPVAILSDFFLGWTNELAASLGLPRVVFSPSGAYAMSVSFSLWVDAPENDDPSDLDFVVSFPRVPKCPKYQWGQISHLYRSGRKGDPDWEFMRDVMRANLESWGIIFNSFVELERIYLDHMKTQMGTDRLWAVGPILPIENEAAPDHALVRGGRSTVPVHELLAWLDVREPSSVVYVCFGSRWVPTEEQVRVIAAALELSRVGFVWCVGEFQQRGGGGGGEWVDALEERVGERGLVIRGWAPQIEIVGHDSVSAFLTHCGWNSTLEGIAAGVVMLTWPMSADQFYNATLVVEELALGVRVGESTRVIPEQTELTRILDDSVRVDKPERLRAGKLRNAAIHAVNGGTSDTDLDGFVQKILELSKK